MIAENKNAVQPYVTWQCKENDIFKSYDYGHYFSTYFLALIDLTEWLCDETQYMLDVQKQYRESSEMLFSENHCIAGSREMEYKD